MSKTVKQVESKIKQLKQRLVMKCQREGIYENFGDKEMRSLSDFIGDIFDYPYDRRKPIYDMEEAFFDWCVNYTG